MLNNSPAGCFGLQNNKNLVVSTQNSLEADKLADFTTNAGRAIYLSIGHGFGDNLMATTVIAGIKKDYKGI
jgi:hypothetical protein